MTLVRCTSLRKNDTDTLLEESLCCGWFIGRMFSDEPGFSELTENNKNVTERFIADGGLPRESDENMMIS